MSQPHVGYTRTSDGVDIAYWRYGEGPVLIETPLIPFSHIEKEWQNPHVRQWFEALGQSVSIVRYDGRCTGLSSRQAEDLSVDGHARDLEAVIDAVGEDRAAVMGVFHSGPAAIAQAVRGSDRISHLILWCAYARGADYWKDDQSEGLRALRQTDYRLFLRTAAHELIGWTDDDRSDAFATVMRAAVEPEEADRLLAATREFDVTDLLGAIDIPTLVLHRRDLDWIGSDLSRSLAAAIPGARLLEVEGRSPLPAAGPIEPALAAITDFLGVSTGSVRAPDAAGVRFVLFTDLVDHSRMMSEIGDELGRQVLREHEALARGAIGEFGGTEIKALGDGFMASFNSVSHALEAAIVLQRRVAERNGRLESDGVPFSIRAGINAGEPLEEDGDLFGNSVILASRISALAGGGQILVSNAVRELGLGKDFVFRPGPTFVPKGFDDETVTWEVGWEVTGQV